MGGDDLGDDDDYLNIKHLPSPASDDDDDDDDVDDSSSSTASVVENNNNNNNSNRVKDGTKKETSSTKKRKAVGEGGGALETTTTTTSTTNSKKKSKKKNPKADVDLSLLENGHNSPKLRQKFLLGVGRDIIKENREIQAAFLWTCYQNFSKKDVTSLEKQDEVFSPDHFYRDKDDHRRHGSTLDQFVKRSVSSMKRLKTHKTCRSPVVLVVCMSARRATVILKSLSSLGVRAAKLFAKHMNVTEQIAMLSSNSYGLAVGTPNRLLKLVQSSDPPETVTTTTALHLTDTQLFLIDCQEDAKKFTVCTSNDTATDLMELIRVAVQPQLKIKKKNNLKIAFV